MTNKVTLYLILHSFLGHVHFLLAVAAAGIALGRVIPCSQHGGKDADKLRRRKLVKLGQLFPQHLAKQRIDQKQQ